MTITATPEPTFRPPRVAIELELAVGSIMQTIEVYRNDGSTRELIRQQPAAGLNERTVYDYEAPRGIPITYEWEVDYTDQSLTTQVWTEAWASLASWITSGGSWSVAGTKLVWTSLDSPSAQVARAVTSGKYRIVFAAVPINIAAINFGGFSIDVTNSRIIVGSQSVTYAPGSTTWTVDVTGSTVTLITSAGTYTVSADVNVTTVSIVGSVAAISYDSAFGTAGGGVLQVSTDVAIDSAGNRYVTDLLANKVIKYNSSGTFVTSWGSAGTADGQFSSPRGIAVDSANNIYVADTNNNRIQKFTAAGAFVAKWGTAGSSDGQFSSPWGITIGPGDVVYVADYGNHRLQKFTSAGAFTLKFGNVGAFAPIPENGRVHYPKSVAVDASGFVYVTDETWRIQKFTNLGVYSSQMGTSGTGNGQINQTVAAPTGLAVDAAGYVYVADQAGHRIQKFSPAGVYVAQFTRSPYSTNTLGGLEVDSAGNIFVTYGANGVHKWIQTGAIVDDITLSSYGGFASLSETSAEITLDSVEGWLVHPGNPALSIPLSYDNLDVSTLEELGTLEQRSTSTVHRILGEKKAIPVSTGPRAGDRFALSIMTETSSERRAVSALLADQTSILLRFPAYWDLDLEEGFYDVGDVTYRRALQLYGQNARLITMPLEAVETPVVAVQNVGWSWAALAAEFATWADVKLAFATWADVLTNNRNPGF